MAVVKLTTAQTVSFFPFKTSSNLFTYKLNSTAIDRNSLLPEYLTHVTTYNYNGIQYLFGYTQGRKSIDIINLQDNSIAAKIELEKIAGYDSEQNILSFSISENYLLILQPEKIYKLKLEGFSATVVLEEPINNDKGIFKTNTFHGDIGFKPAMDKNGSIYVMNLRYDVRISDPAYYLGNNEVKIICGQNKSQYDFVPVSYPDNYHNAYYGYYYTPRRLVLPLGNHVFSYTASSIINTWNPETNEIATKDVKSKFQTDEIGKLSNDKVYSTKELLAYTVTNAVYTTLMYDQYRDIYYRFFRPEIKEGRDCNSCNYQNKPLVIMILDKDFNVLDELYLASTIYEEQTSFVGEKGLYLSCANTKNPNFGNGYISYDILSYSLLENNRSENTRILNLANTSNNGFLVTGAWDSESIPVLTVFDLNGKIVYRDIYNSGKIVELQDIAAGIYMLSISDADESILLKWVKN